MSRDLHEAIAKAAGAEPLNMSAMGGGCVAEVYRVNMKDGRTLVAKAGGAGSGLALEGMMLSYLAERSGLPVPEVIHADDDLLLMSYIETGGGLGAKAQVQAAELLADLHSISDGTFGFERATVIGGLRQPNPLEDSWPAFFRDHRLLFMGREAMKAGRLPGRVMDRIEALAGRIDRWLDGNSKPSLIHGDMWSGNVLCNPQGIAGFVDPAIYYADAEIELAFSTLFGTFSDDFFRRYNEIRPLKPGFFEERRDLYNLYPLLVHVRLFGGHYVGSVERTLSQFGF
ncbi:MAG: fructosamine kinase family protein [Rhodospirillales bacterium]